MPTRRPGGAAGRQHERWPSRADAADAALLPLASLRDMGASVLVEQDGIVVACSEAAARLLGAEDAASVAGQPFGRFFDADARARIRAALEAPPGRAVPPTVAARRESGERTHVEVLPIPLRRSDRAALQLVLLEAGERAAASADEVVTTEEQLRQAQRMNAVGRLAAGIAHDFNNILTAIHGHVSLLLEQLPEGSGSREDALDIKQAAERASELTKQLLHFARGRRGQPVPIDVNHVVIDVGRLMRRLIASGIELRTDLQPDLPVVIADPGQVQQVVLNLVVNASEAIEQTGTIVVATRALRLPDAAPELGLERGEYVQVAVSDTGPGLSEEMRERIFEPFFTTKPQGTGLGLSTVYGIVRRCGGVVRVRSEGPGATFEVILPAGGRPVV